MARLDEIKRLIEEGRTDRQIAKMLKVRRLTVGSIRKGLLDSTTLKKAKENSGRIPPAWTLRVDWKAVEKEITQGFENKRIWEEYASEVTSHSNFFKYTSKRFEQLLKSTVTLREFRPGEYAEVDYAGDRIEWINRKGQIQEAHIFIGILCFSQLIFAFAAENEKKENWLMSHRKMFEFYGRVPQVLVCDQLKTGVSLSHLYDPDLNPDYVAFLSHYGTACVPARVRRPKDKSLVEGAVKLVIRLFRWVYRRHTFTSLDEVNRALTEVVNRLNTKTHTRYKTSRLKRFQELEKASLKPLPLEPYEHTEWKTAVGHPDCTVSVENNFYSIPHQYRGKEVRVKITAQCIECFFELERIALHQRLRGRVGERIVDHSHLPANSRAYRETTPQNILCQAKFIHPDLHALIQELFDQDTLANIRKAQGFIRKAHLIIQNHGRQLAEPWIKEAIAHLKRYGQIRVRTFEEAIKQQQKKSVPSEDRTIIRLPGNPMVRRAGENIGNPSYPGETIH